MHIALTGEHLPGRKRKYAARRKPCGRIAPDKRPDDRLKVARQPHRRGLEEELRMDERAESALGRALLRGALTEGQYSAGVRYAVVVGEYRASIEVPRGAAGTGRGFDCFPEACMAEPGICQCRQRKRRYYQAFEALSDAGRHILWQVVHVAIEDREPTTLAHLRIGLEALAKHFGFA